MEFTKIWPLTCHNWVKCWPRTKNNTTNRKYSARAICWSFPRSSTTLRLETPRGGGRTNPPPTPAKEAKHGLRARVKNGFLPCIWSWISTYLCEKSKLPTNQTSSISLSLFIFRRWIPKRLRFIGVFISKSSRRIWHDLMPSPGSGKWVRCVFLW